MKQNINYINALPDFLEMQRISFCWFITQGLNEELALFSRIHDFSQNTEYIMFGEEYNLIKPPYSLLIARKYSGNYRAQLVIPIEVRNKIINSVHYPAPTQHTITVVFPTQSSMPWSTARPRVMIRQNGRHCISRQRPFYVKQKLL